MPVPFKTTVLARALAGAGAGIAVGLALFALAGWLSGRLELIGSHGGNVPIAPGTALVLLLLGVALALRDLGAGSRAAGAACSGLAGAALVLSGDVCIRGFAGLESSWEHWLLAAPHLMRGIPVGRISPFSAVLFVLTSLPLVTGPLRPAPRRWIRIAGDAAAGASALVALTLILGYTTGAPLFYSSGLVPVALLTAIAVLALDAGLLAGGVVGWLAGRGRLPAVGPAAAGRPAVEWRRLIAFGATAALVVLASGVIYLRARLASMRDTASHELAAIGDLKADAIISWRSERTQDVRDLAAIPAVARAMAALFSAPGGGAAALDLAGFVDPLLARRPYAGAIFLDGRGEPRLSLPAAFRPDPPLLRAAREALAARAVTVADLHNGGTTETVVVDLLAPVADPAGGPAAAPIGVIAVRVNAGGELTRLLGNWPIPSETAETLLVRREGDEVVFLNELRHRAGTALRLRFPLSDPDLPASSAARGESSVREGIDYRGVRVLAAVRPVPGTPWSLVAKVDQQEIYAPLRRQAGAVAIVVFALLVATGLWTEMTWRRRVARLLAQELDVERRYRELADRFALLTRYGSDVIVMADEAGRIVEANERAAEAYGRTHEELLALTQADLRAPATRPALAEDMAPVTVTGGRLFETIHRRKDGTTFPVEVNCRRVQVGGQTFRLEFIRDITRRKELEEERRRFAAQIEQTQHLESLGVMAGGVAHDFNNLLTTILGRAGLMLLQGPADPASRESLKEIEKAAERGASLCRQMLAYAGKGQVVLEALNLSRLVDEMTGLLNVSIPAKIAFRCRLDDGIPPVHSDGTQLRQVIMNLVVNAAEAIADREGTIEVSTGVMDCDEAYLAADTPIVPPAPGRYVYLEVSDTGGGMDAATQARIFDPFFTTKTPGRGLGLPAVLGIVLNNRGSLKVRSEPGKGATFRVLFPVANGLPPPEPVGSSPPRRTDTEAG